jgi:sulfoxide reductase catalytic subunit YedY
VRESQNKNLIGTYRLKGEKEQVMLIKRRTGIEIPSSEITPKHLYLSRRQFMKGLGGLAATSLLAACGIAEQSSTDTQSQEGSSTDRGSQQQVSAQTDELGDALTSYQDVTHYNNYYEFSLDKEGVADAAKEFNTSPWEIEVGGMVRNPGTYDLSDLLTKFEQEERIYRLRCVEAWSMVIPWLGFKLSDLIKQFEPTSKAKYVFFETL